MKLYVVLLNDRHSDPDVTIFDTPDAAIAHARKAFQNTVAHPDAIEEKTIKGYLYFAMYLPAEDYVYVMERTLNEAT